MAGWTDWRNSINSTNADIYAYVSSFTGPNIRLTTLPGRLCEFIQGNCNGFGFGSDQMKVAASANGVFFAVGLDWDNNPASNCAVACTVTNVGVIRLVSSPGTGIPTSDFLITGLAILTVLVLAVVYLRHRRASRAEIGPQEDGVAESSLSPRDS